MSRLAGSRPRIAGRPRLRRPYYGWILAAGLGVSAAVSYGILYYSFAVFIVPMGEELGWPQPAITGAFSLATFVAGLAAIPVGRWIDRRGARGVMTVGSLLAVTTLLTWSRVESLAAFYVLSVALGLAMAAVFYEPAFAVLATWFVRYHARALTLLTFVGGFASVVFVPLTTALVEAAGWRAALAWLAVVLGTFTIPLHALLLRHRPEDIGLLPDGRTADDVSGARPTPEPHVTARLAVRLPSFRWLAVAFGLSTVVSTGVMIHLIPLLLVRGYEPAFAGAALGLLGLMAMPGRVLITPLHDRWPTARVTAAIFAVQTIGVASLLTAQSTAGVWIFVVLFGAGYGAISPARATIVAELYGRDSYGSISGVLALLISGSRALGPIGLSLMYVGTGSYGPVLLALMLMLATASWAVLSAGSPVNSQRGHRGFCHSSDQFSHLQVPPGGAALRPRGGDHDRS